MNGLILLIVYNNSNILNYHNMNFENGKKFLNFSTLLRINCPKKTYIIN
jgi:hypothetical protein